MWVGMDFAQSGDWLANLPKVPKSVRLRRHEMWHFKHALEHDIEKGDALFLATWNLRFVPYMKRFRSYHYVDFSPSLMKKMSPWYDHFYKKSRLHQLGRELLARRLPRSARGVIAMSDWCARGIVEDYGISPERVHTVLPGANLNRWHFVDRSSHPEKVVRILMVGGEFKRKGGDALLAWAEKNQDRGVEIDIATWPGQLPDRVLQMMGPLPASEVATVSLAPWLPNVRVHCGKRPNSPELLQLFEQADIFCLPTRGDFSSIASLEAMATGLPVVVGGVGGIPELIEEGKTGFLVEPDNASQLERALEQLIGDRSRRLAVGRAARTACEDHLNIQRQIRQIASIMDVGA